MLASADGLVASVNFDSEYGYTVLIRHDIRESRGGFWATAYTHLEAATVEIGSRVHRGDRIGRIGLFPASGGVVHVHWELRLGGGMVDPLPWTSGCFESRTYDVERLELTYPVTCD